MSEKKRVASLSRGFGISVIATGDNAQSSKSGLPRIQTNAPGSTTIDDIDADISIVSQSTMTDAVTDEIQNASIEEINSNTSNNPNNSNKSVIIHNINDENNNENENANNSNSKINTTKKDIQIDVSLSSSNLRRPSFNRIQKIHSSGQQQINNRSPTQNNIKAQIPPPKENSNYSEHSSSPQNIQFQKNVKTLPMSQRFKSTPSFHSPSPSMIPSPIINSKSNTSSPYLAQSRRSQHNLHSFSNNNNINQSNIRLPRRRSCQQLTKKQKDKLYEDDQDTFDDSSADIFMYNVPIASSASLRLFQNSNALKSTEVLRKAWNESESNIIIPPSPLPGKLSNASEIATFSNLPDEIPSPLIGLTSSSISSSIPTSNNNSSIPTSNSSPSNKIPKTPIGISNSNFESPSLMKNPSFNALSPTAQQLSTFYEYSSHNQAEEELKKRKQQSTPTTVDPTLSSVIDDLSLASSEKLAKLSVTRPSWIPPKEEAELHKHEKEFKRMIERTSKEALKTSKHQLKIQQERTIGDARLKYLSEKLSLTSSNCSEIRKYILITDIDSTTKFKIFRKLIIHKLGENTLLSPPFQKNDSNDLSFDEKFDKIDIISLLEPINKIPTKNEISCLETILQPIARPIPSNSVDINKLPKIPSLPIQTLLKRLAKIALIMLRCNYSTPQVRDLIYWLHAHILTVKFKEEFNKLLTKNSVSKQFKEFKDDYSILTVPTSMDLLLDLDEIFVCKCIEMLIVFWSLGNSRGVRIFIATVICVIRDYHFGWNNLQVIFHSKAHVYVGDGKQNEEKFFGRVIGHYALIK